MRGGVCPISGIAISTLTLLFFDLSKQRIQFSAEVCKRLILRRDDVIQRI